jgi:hypothetical protein
MSTTTTTEAAGDCERSDALERHASILERPQTKDW